MTERTHTVDPVALERQLIETLRLVSIMQEHVLGVLDLVEALTARVKALEAERKVH